MTDGTVIRANASIHSLVLREGIELDEVEQKKKSDEFSVNNFRTNTVDGKRISNKSHVNPNDPEATLAGRNGEFRLLSYRSHTSIDAESRVIVDCFVTTGAVSDTTPYIERIDHIENHFEQKIECVVADRGYGSAENLQALEDKGIESNIPLWSTRSGKTFSEDQTNGFKINDDEESAQCPEGQLMKKLNTKPDRILFAASTKICGKCPRFKTCLTKSEQKNAGRKVLRVPIHHAIFSSVLEKQKRPEFKEQLRDRMWKVEGIFAEAKSHHGLRRARYRGRAKMQMQVYAISTVQNLKRLAARVAFSVIALTDEFFRNVILRFQKRDFQNLAITT